MVRLSTGRDSKSDYQTPPEFIKAVTDRFGPISFDLAASYWNTQHPDRFFDIDHDSLKQPWAALSSLQSAGSLLWLNPPFNNVRQWARKCAAEAPNLKNGVLIAFLVPASVGSNWFRDYVIDKADVYFLNGRLSFDGKNAFPKDCLLGIYGERYSKICTVWNWRNDFAL